MSWARSAWTPVTRFQDMQMFLKDGYQYDVVVLVYNLNDVSDLMSKWRSTVTRSRRPPPFLFEHSFFLNTLWVRLEGCA